MRIDTDSTDATNSLDFSSKYRCYCIRRFYRLNKSEFNGMTRRKIFEIGLEENGKNEWSRFMV